MQNDFFIIIRFSGHDVIFLLSFCCIKKCEKEWRAWAFAFLLLNLHIKHQCNRIDAKVPLCYHTCRCGVRLLRRSGMHKPYRDCRRYGLGQLYDYLCGRQSYALRRSVPPGCRRPPRRRSAPRGRLGQQPLPRRSSPKRRTPMPLWEI